MTRYNIILLLVAMIGAGVLGGAANYLLLHKDDPEYAKRSRSFVLGLVASLLAPLFLKTISSDMVDKISTIRYGSGDPLRLFRFRQPLPAGGGLLPHLRGDRRQAAGGRSRKGQAGIPRSQDPGAPGGRKGQPSRARASTRNGAAHRTCCPSPRGTAFRLHFRTFPSIIPTVNF